MSGLGTAFAAFEYHLLRGLGFVTLRNNIFALAQNGE